MFITILPHTTGGKWVKRDQLSRLSPPGYDWPSLGASRATSAAELVFAKRFVSARSCKTSASISGSRPLRTWGPREVRKKMDWFNKVASTRGFSWVFQNLLAKLVQITPISLGFVMHISILGDRNQLVTGARHLEGCLRENRTGIPTIFCLKNKGEVQKKKKLPIVGFYGPIDAAWNHFVIRDCLVVEPSQNAISESIGVVVIRQDGTWQLRTEDIQVLQKLWKTGWLMGMWSSYILSPSRSLNYRSHSGGAYQIYQSRPC